MAKKSETKTDAMPAPNNDWEHEDNARTLKRAAEILGDENKLKGAHKHLKKEKKQFKSLDQLIDFKNRKFGANGDQDNDVED